MLFIRRVGLLVALATLIPLVGFAQQTDTALPAPVPLTANAGADQQGLINQELLFDAEVATLEAGQTATYSWDFDDGTSAQGEQARHAYKRRGDYTVTLTVTTSDQVVSDQVLVKIFEQSVILITDAVTTPDQISEAQRQAEREDRLLLVVEDRVGDTDFVREDNLSRLLLEKSEDIRRADIIIDWTTGDTGLNALSKFAQTVPSLDELRMSSKAIISLSDPSVVISRIAQSTFDILKPNYILLTNATALDAVLEAQNADQVIDGVQQTGNEIRLIGTFSERALKDLTPLNVISFLVNFMINKGVPVNTIVLILMLPIIATIFAFARQIIGLRAFGIYIPTIVTVSFLALGITYGLTVFFVVLVMGTLLRVVMRRVRLSYIPRLAIVLTVTSFAILGLLAVGALTNQTTFVALAIFPILIMVALSEQFVAAQIEKGFTAAVFLTGETLILSIITYYLVSWDPFQSLILAYPEIILLTIVVNIFLGRWTGLRLTEYYRFRQVRRFSKLP
jgi:hypothetical protein